jgi:TIR domain
MRPSQWYLLIAAAGLTVAMLLPLSSALTSGEVHQARFIGAVVTSVVCAAFAVAKAGRPAVWTTLAMASGGAGVVLMLAHVDANQTCLAQYDGRAVLIGRELTPVAADYVVKNPGTSGSDLLLDAGGVAERIWTSKSISSCRFWVGYGGVLGSSLFAAMVCALVARRGVRFTQAPAAPRIPRSAAQPARPVVYDAFLSYRHADLDKRHATDLLDALESRGLRVAVDFRDFVPNQHFLSEMERCIKESRFVLCVVTSQYLDSGNCSEEAIISKTLDMADRRRRLVPLIFERVELPVWMHGIVGIDFTESAGVDPLERLVRLLKTDQE